MGVGVDVGAGVEVGTFVVSAVDVMAVVVSIGVVSAGASFAHELDRISMEAVRIARTLKNAVYSYTYVLSEMSSTGFSDIECVYGK